MDGLLLKVNHKLDDHWGSQLLKNQIITCLLSPSPAEAPGSCIAARLSAEEEFLRQLGRISLSCRRIQAELLEPSGDEW